MWPASAGAQAPGASGAPSGFDVSDVDLTNIPDLDCDKYLHDMVWNSCRSWFRHPGLGVAGSRVSGSRSDKVKTSYIQIKNAPVDEAELEALKQQLIPNYKDYGAKIEIISVPYDFGELWRWSVILDRFALSAGNTIGVVGSKLRVNFPVYSGEDVWLNGVEPAGPDKWGISHDWPAIREILVVRALDPPLVVAALPELLPKLGIPADAVGLVYHVDMTPKIEVTSSEAPRSKSVPEPDTEIQSESQTVSAAAPAESNAPVANAKTDEADGQDDPAQPKQQTAVADSSGRDTNSAVAPRASETDQDNGSTPDQRSVSAPTSGEQPVSEVKAKASETSSDDDDATEPKQQTAPSDTPDKSANLEVKAKASEMGGQDDASEPKQQTAPSDTPDKSANLGVKAKASETGGQDDATEPKQQTAPSDTPDKSANLGVKAKASDNDDVNESPPVQLTPNPDNSMWPLAAGVGVLVLAVFGAAVLWSMRSR